MLYLQVMTALSLLVDLLHLIRLDLLLLLGRGLRPPLSLPARVYRSSAFLIKLVPPLLLVSWIRDGFWCFHLSMLAASGDSPCI